MKAYIYKIYCKDTNIVDFYVGQTNIFERRKLEHRLYCNDKYKQKLYTFINNNGGWDNWLMEIIEEIDCETNKEILEKEKYYIQELNATLNTTNIKRTKQIIKTDKQICKEKSNERKKLWLEQKQTLEKMRL
jgi:hypothetical protein